MDQLISPETLAGRLDDATIRVVDVRWYLANPKLGRRRFEESHIPGAVFVDLETELSDPSVPDAGRHPLPDRAFLADLLGSRGIGTEHTIVAYDDSGGAIAARLWWLLRWLGHDSVAVLDGGWRAWTEAGFPLSSEAPAHPPAVLRPGVPLTRVVDRDTVAALGDRPLLDARSPERYRGEIEPVDPVPGHIPGAVNIPTATLLGPNGRFLPREELAGMLGRTDDAIASCGSGVTACALILAAVAAGLPEPALYPGSYSEWSRAGLPVESA